jgi:hypothetical protein
VYRLYRYIINLVDVRPDSDRLSVYRISKTLKDFELTRIAHVVNTYSQSLVSTLLSSEYGGLKPGVYVASVGRVADRDMLRDELKNAFARCFEVLSQRSSEQKHIRPFPLFYDVDELVNALVDSVAEEAVPSTSYVAANLLNNLMGRSVPNQYKCYEKGVRICIKLDVKALRELMQKDEELSREPLFNFCRERPSLCGEGNDGCARFFRVVKELHIRFQHSVVNDEEKIYIVFFSQYRRLSNLELKGVIDFLKNGVKLSAKDVINALGGIRVNVTLPEGSVLYEIRDVKSEGGSDVVELECVDKELGGPRELRIHYNELEAYKVRINPTYKSSRELIYNYLCKYYDEHKKLSWITPSTYFKILEDDLKIFRRLLAEFKLSNIVLGNVTYAIGSSFVWV